MTDTKHPMMMSVVSNKVDGRFELVLQVGNFVTEEEVREYSDGLAEHLRKWEPMNFLDRAQ